MNLGEALSKLKKEKSKLARLIALRKANVFIEKGEKPNFDPQQLTEEINKKIDEIRLYKLRIQRTNLSTKVKGKNMTLAEAILKVNDLRSKIAQLTVLFEKEKNYFYRDKDEVKRVPTLDENEIEDEIEKLVIAKVQLDNEIQMTNWATQLMD